MRRICNKETNHTLSLYEYIFECQVNRKTIDLFEYVNGEKRINFECTLFPIKFQSEDCLAIILKDETLRMQLNQEKEKRVYQKKLVNTVTHELRTPLNGTISMLQIMEKKNKDPEMDSYIKIAISTSLLLLSLISDILDFAQIEAQRLKIINTSFILKLLITECCEIIGFQIKQRNLELKVNLRDDVPRQINADKNRYRQIILNLLSNAIKFTREGFIVIEIWYDKVNSLLFTSVQDSGVGISKEDQSALFQQFGKLEDSKQINPQGKAIQFQMID